MSNYATLKSAIQSAVYTNGNGEITGAGLQTVLLQIVNTVGDGYVFKGVATAGTAPGTPDNNVFYIAPAGTYDNFGSSYTVPVGSIGVFSYNGSWSHYSVGVVNIEDSLTSSSAVDALSANQGKLLNEKIDTPVISYPNKYVGPNGTLVQPSSQTTWHCDLYRIENGIVIIKGKRNENYDAPVYADVIFYSSESVFDGTTFIARGINAGTINEYEVPEGTKMMLLCRKENSGILNWVIGYSAVIPQQIRLLTKNSIEYITENDFSIPYVFIRPNGTPSDGSTPNSWVATDYIACAEGDILSIYASIHSGAAGCFYDSNQSPVKVFYSDPLANVAIIQVPSGAEYIRLCNSTNILAEGFRAEIVGRAELPTTPQNQERSYFSILKKPFVFNGKTCVFCGDSITYGSTSGTTDVHGTGDYPTLLSSILGFTMSNLAIKGALFTAGYNAVTTIVQQVENAPTNIDYLFIAGGINDWQMSVPLDTFRTTISNLCDYINTNFASSVNVIWITPINEAGWTPQGTEGTVQDYRNIITEVVMCKNTNFNFSIIEGNELNFPTSDASSSFKSAMFGDLLHPTALGYKCYTTGLLGKLL